MIDSSLILCFDTQRFGLRPSSSGTNEIYKLNKKKKETKIPEELRNSQKFRVDRGDVYKVMRHHTLKKNKLRDKLMETHKNRQKSSTFL